jgi:hypothetical protein
MVEELGRWTLRAGFDLALDSFHAPGPVLGAIKKAGVRRAEADQAVLQAALAEGAGASEAFSRAASVGWRLPVKAEGPAVLQVSGSRAAAASEFLSRSGVDMRPVAVCPEASSVLKRWPLERFASLADWVIRSTARHVVVFGSSPEGPAGAVCQLIRKTDRVVAIYRQHLADLAALLASCAVLVTNDTGLMHIADAVGTPVVGIFGPTRPQVYLPRSTPSVALGGSNINCDHQALGMNPPGCWQSGHCLIATECCTSAVQTEAVISVLPSMLGTARTQR